MSPCPVCKRLLALRRDGTLPAHLRKMRACPGSRKHPIVVVPLNRPRIGDTVAWCARCSAATPHDLLWSGRVRQCLCCLTTSGSIAACLREAAAQPQLALRAEAVDALA